MKLISMEPQFNSPLYIIWEITRQCNYNCSYCSFKNKHVGHISYSNLLKCLENLSSSKYTFDLDFIGGEPTIYPHYLDLLENSIKLLPNSNIYTTTNTSSSLTSYKQLHNKLKNYESNRIRFYFSYHIDYVNLNDYIEKVNFLGDLGYPVFIKLVCDNKNLEKTKEIFDKLKQTNFNKFFLKYLWNYRETNLYNNDYLKWMEENTFENDYHFQIKYLDNNITKTEIVDYKKIKKYNFDILTNYDCYVNRLLYIDIFGYVYPSCLKEHIKPQMNIYLKSINSLFDRKDELKKCKQKECTELFNNPNKFIGDKI